MRFHRRTMYFRYGVIVTGFARCTIRLEAMSNKKGFASVKRELWKNSQPFTSFTGCPVGGISVLRLNRVIIEVAAINIAAARAITPREALPNRASETAVTELCCDSHVAG